MGFFQLRCLLCGHPRESYRDGRCLHCQSLFLLAPELCVHCARPRTVTQSHICLTHWQSTSVKLHSLHALYFAIGEMFPILKAIKKRGGGSLPSISKWIHADLLRSPWFKDFREAEKDAFVCEIPQTPERKLQFSAPLVPTWRKVLNSELNLPVVSLLIPLPSISRQGEMSAQSRLKTKDRFELDRSYNPRVLKSRTIFLVDDLMTTGSTLHAALRALEPLQPQGVRILLLGLRPRIRR